MPSRNLKSALLSQQADAARRTAQARASEHRRAKESSIKANLTGSKKPSKRNPTSHPITASIVPIRTIPFDRSDTLLLLGEANFSFALSLISAPHHHPPHLICATSYDSESACAEKYPDAMGNVAELRRAGVRIGFGVDAGALEGCKVVGKGKRWSRVIFNFPHAGAGITDQDRNILSNQHLLLRTLRSVAPLLTEGPSAFPVTTSSKKKGKSKSKSKVQPRKRPTPTTDQSDDSDDPEADDDGPPHPEYQPPPSTTFSPPDREGTILISLLNQPPYTLWDLPHLATRPPSICPGTNLAQPRYRLLRSFEFRPEVYNGYAHRRTIGWKEGLSTGGNEDILGRNGKARTWEFALMPGDGSTRGNGR